MPAVSGGPAFPAPPPPPPKPIAQPRPPSAFPSLGQRVQISRIADGYQQGIAPGTRYPINTYQKEQIEAAGSMENFVLMYLRPVHGPFAGEPPGTYLFQQLDTSARPLPGAEWTVTVGPAETGRPQPGYGNQQVAAPAAVFQLPSVPTANGVPPTVQADLFTRILDREFLRADREAAEARQQREELEKKREKHGISDMMYLAMLQQIPQPRPVDPAEVARQVKAELDRLQPTSTLPTTPSMLDFGSPKEDPALGRVMAMLERLLEKQSQPPPPPPPQKEPVVAFGEMLALFERARPPPDPLQGQLAALALKTITEPSKPKTLADLLQEMKLLKEANTLLGNESGPPSIIEGIVQVVDAITNNAEALGNALARIRTGAVNGAFETAKQKRLQAKPPVKQEQPAQPQRVLPSQATQEKLVAMCNGIQNGDEDQKIVENLLGVVQQLETDPDPTGVDRWKRFSQATVKRYLDVESAQEIQGLVFWFFEQLGAKKLYTSYPKVLERLCQALTDNYSVIHALLTGGKERSLPTSLPTPNAVPAQPPVAAQANVVASSVELSPPALKEAPGSPKDDGGEEDEEDGVRDEQESPTQAAS